MGLKGVPGLIYPEPSEITSGQVGGSSHTANKNPVKRGLEDNHDSGARPSRRTAHQGMPGSLDDNYKPNVDLKQIEQQRPRGGGRAKMPKRRAQNQ